MGLFNWLGKLFYAPAIPDAQRPKRRRQPSYGSRVMSDLTYPGMGRYGLQTAWSASRTEQVQHFTGWVYVAIDSICKKFAQQRPGVYAIRQRPTLEMRAKCLSSHYRSKAITDLKPEEELEPVDEQHALNQLFQNPNEPDTSYDFWYETMLYLLITGNSYWWLPRNGYGLPAEAWVMPAHWMWPVIGQDKQLESYDVRPLFGSGRHNLPAEDVVHLRFKNPISKYDGYAPLSAINRWVDVDESIDVARWGSFNNGMFPGLAIILNEGLGVSDPTQDEQLKRLEAQLEAKFRGPGQTGRAIVMGGVKDAKPIFTTPQEMAYESSSEQMRDKVLAGYRVSKVIAGISTEVNRASMEGAQVAFCELTINPLCFMMGATVTEKVAWRYDRKLRVSWMNVTPDDAAMKLQQQQADVLAGAVTPNEIRKERGRQAYTHGGDDPILPAGVAPMPLNTEEEQFDFSALVGDAQQQQDRHDFQQTRMGKEPTGEPAKRPTEAPAEITAAGLPAPTTDNALRSTVGGLQAIAGLQSQYYSGALPREAAIANVMLLFAFSQQEAEALFPLKAPVDLTAGNSNGNGQSKRWVKSLKAINVPDVRQDHPYDCGAAAFRAVCQLRGVGPKDEDEFIRLLGTNPEDGTEPTHIVNAAQELGLHVQEFSGDLEGVLLDRYVGKGWPVIVCVQSDGDLFTRTADEEGHYIVVTATTDKIVTVQDPVDGKKDVPRGQFLSSWHDVDGEGREYRAYGIAIGPVRSAAALKRLPLVKRVGGLQKAPEPAVCRKLRNRQRKRPPHQYPGEHE